MTKFFIEHTTPGDDGDTAFFGPIPEDQIDGVLDTPEANLWAQTGELRVIDNLNLAFSQANYVNSWSAWLNPGEEDAPVRSADFEHGEHTVLVAFSVYGDGHKDAAEVLASALGWANLVDDAPITEWWIAEDDRSDGSDNDSAVFVTPGKQSEASQLLAENGLTPNHNIVER